MTTQADTAGLFSGSPTAAAVDTGDAVYVAATDTSRVVRLTATGAMIWRELSGGATPPEITELLISLPGAPAADVVAANMTEFLKSLQRLGLVSPKRP